MAGVCLAAALWGAPATFPIKDVRAGQRGTGKTVFSGNRVEEFQFEVLGVLDNIGPKQSLILARLSGGPLAETGVMQGMSGSPVYLEGKLLGAVAMAFPFAKEPIAGIRPIEEMLASANASVSRRIPVPGALPHKSLDAAPAYTFGESRLSDIATPFSFGGFTRATIDHFTPELRAMGLEPRQGISSGTPLKFGDPKLIQPGSMISVQLLSGDMSAGADGTVTMVDGNRVFAFGHRFLAAGETDLPFARAEVLTLLSNVSSSFKISAAREWMGAITGDRNTAIYGELGRRAAMVPVTISVGSGAAGGGTRYRIQMVNDRFLSPFLLQMAVFSAIDATERSIGVSSFSVDGRIDFEGAPLPVKFRNVYSGDFAVPAQAALNAAIPLAYALGSGFDVLKVKNIDLTIGSWDEKKQMQIDQVWTSRPWARPGEAVELNVLLSGPNGAESAHKVAWQVPIGAPPGPVYFTVADGSTTNITEFAQFIASPPKSAAQVVSFLNDLRGNTQAWVRVWRAEPNYQIQGEDFPAPPASMALILSKAQPWVSGNPLARNSKVAEMSIDAGQAMVTGSKTVQIEIKE